MGDGGRARPASDTAEGRRVPALRRGVDPASFRLDPISTKLLQLVDGRSTIAEVAVAAGLDLSTAIDRLRALVAAELITLTGDSLAPAAGPAPERAATPGGEPAERRDEVRPDAEGQAWARATGGDLASKPAVTVLEEAAGSSFTGGIRFERAGVRIECHFVKGQPLGVVSTDAQHDHGAMLLAADRITEDVLRAYHSALSQGAPHPVAALIKAGLADRKQLALHLTWRGSAILKEVAGWREGTCATASGLPFPKGLEQLRLLLPRTRRINWREARLDAEQTAVLESNRAKYLVASPTLSQTVAGLRLDAKEGRFVEHVAEQPIQLSQAFTISILLRSVTKNLLFHLIHAGAFELHDTSPEGITPYDLDELEPLLRMMDKDNHFNVLTVHPVSTEREIGERHEKRLAEYDPSLYPGATPEQLEILGRIRDRIDRAYRVLADREQRQEYRRRICGRDQLMTFVDLQLRKAEVALKMRGQAAEAVELAASALDINPSSVASRLLLAEALAATGRTREARQHLQGLGAVPAELKRDYEALRRRLG